MSEYDKNAALVTGATSGLGFEAAAQLAELGFGSVTLTARTQDKADAAAQQLRDRTGVDAFDTLVVDVGVIESSRKAAAELVNRGRSFDPEHPFTLRSIQRLGSNRLLFRKTLSFAR